MGHGNMQLFRLLQHPQPKFSRLTQAGTPGLLGGQEGGLGRNLWHGVYTSSTALNQPARNGLSDLSAEKFADQEGF